MALNMWLIGLSALIGFLSELFLGIDLSEVSGWIQMAVIILPISFIGAVSAQATATRLNYFLQSYLPFFVSLIIGREFREYLEDLKRSKRTYSKVAKGRRKGIESNLQMVPLQRL